MAQANIKVTLEGRGPLTLRESNYVTSGGEGSIYLAGSTIVKIYAKPDKMIADGMPDKIALLSKIRHPVIVVPTGVVADEKGLPIGFYMPQADGEPMPRVFTADFRARTGFDDAAAKHVTAQMWAANNCAHDHGAVMVDANEFNWIVDTTFEPKVIDVDSWAIGRWPATVIMPSIRDWRAKTFDALTDWFSWGVVAFQVFTGIHPFKGKLDGYKPGELERRMRENASVFAPGVRLPASARDPSCIPGPLLDWFRSEFEDGKRSVPPSPTSDGKPTAAAAVMRTVVGGAGLIHEKVYENRHAKTVRTWPYGVALLENGAAVDMASGRLIAPLGPNDDVVALPGGGWLLASGQKIAVARDGAVAPVAHGLAVRRMFSAADRLFAVTDAELIEIGVREVSGRVMANLGQRWGIRPNATQFFDGVAVQDVLGAAFLVLPTADGIAQVKLRELDGLTPVAGVGLGRFASIVAADRSGAYHRVEVTFPADLHMPKVWIGPNDGPDLNMVVVPSGVVATIVNDGEVVIFVPANGNIRHVADAGATTAIRLSRWGSKVTYVKDGAVWSMRTK